MINATRLKKARERLQAARDERQFETGKPTFLNDPDYLEGVATVRKFAQINGKAPEDFFGVSWRHYCTPWFGLVAHLRDPGNGEDYDPAFADELERLEAEDLDQFNTALRAKDPDARFYGSFALYMIARYPEELVKQC